jgi:hypothetical protein
MGLTLVPSLFPNKGDINDLRQTANHYRHTGEPQRYPLPKNAPDLAKATQVVFQLLRKWLDDAAIARGVLGAPTMELDGRLFWGLDALPGMRRAFWRDRCHRGHQRHTD